MYSAFREKMAIYPIFSIKDVALQFPQLDSRRLTEWQQKHYLTKLRNSYYLFTEKSDTKYLRYFISNTIYQPSYISLQSALHYHGYIPEATFSVMAVSTKKTNRFQTPRGTYLYKTIKPKAFLGYQLLNQQGVTVRIASAEKSLVDFLYLNKSLRNEESIQALRLNQNKMNEEFSFETCSNYASFFESKVLNRMVSIINHLYA